MRVSQAIGGAWLALSIIGSPAFAEDRHTGYYYPAPTTSEVYEARALVLPDSDRKRRIGFVTLLTQQTFTQPYQPDFAIFAKGEEAEKLIIVGLQDGRLDTIYRARALFAMLTAVARDSELFRDYKVEDLFTFFDLCKLLGFTQITITDGRDFAHQVFIQ
jgi:hypothetical protein